jgi:hypothetical protein
MSRHVVMSRKGDKKWIFGWDQPLQSFYLQVHDMNLPEDERIVAWLGADKNTYMYEVEDLFQVAKMYGLAIDHTYRPVLYREKDDGI